MKTVRVKGAKKVLKRLNKAISKIENRTEEGLELAATFVEGEAKELTSVDEGILINSTFTKVIKRAKEFFAVIGYTADYAPHVHEMPENTNWNKAGAENQFLLKAITRNLSKIFNIVRRTAGRP